MTMMMLNVLGVIVAYVLVASWSYRRGRAVLAICATVFLVVLMVVAMGLAPLFDVPTTPRLFLYVLLIGAPIVMVPTWLLLLLHGNNSRVIGPVPIAAVGAAVGFVLGYMFSIVVFPTP
jgi:hypothetical protein